MTSRANPSQRGPVDWTMLVIAGAASMALAAFAGKQAEVLACRRAGGRLMHAGLDSICRAWSGQTLTVTVLPDSPATWSVIVLGVLALTGGIYAALVRIARPGRAA